MKMISELIIRNKIEGVTDYIKLNKKIEDWLFKNKVKSNSTINIALLSSSTINGIKETLRVLCAQFNVHTNFYVGGYNQYAQEILDSKSDLYTFKADFVFLFVDTMTICGELYFLPYDISYKERYAWIDNIVSEFSNLAKSITKNSKSKVILHNLEVPIYSPLGILENKQELGFIESIEMINEGLRNNFKKNNQIFLFDYNAFCSGIGKNNIIDYKMYYLGDLKIDPKNIPNLCKNYVRFLRPFAAASKKCIVLDLDNTLWGGVIGEDGLGGIDLGPTPKGRPFLEFQKFILSLFNRGIILAINSKNNIDDAINVMKNHPYMILKEKNFIAMRINWEDKATNIISLAKEINIGLDSMVFIDDDQINRDLIKKYVPEVTVVDLPKDSSLYVKTLINLNLFDSMNITSEDLRKGEMYIEEKNRRKSQENILDLSDYLKELKLQVSIEEAKSITIPRISQLTQKTNQFNMTTRRYTVEDINQFNNSNEYLVISINVSDKFGDYGLTGVAILEKVSKYIWRIDTFLLSCRVLGRNVENALLVQIINIAKKNNIQYLHGEFISTQKNKPAQEFYQKFGFKKISNNKNNETWELDLSINYSLPDFIKFKIGKL